MDDCFHMKNNELMRMEYPMQHDFDNDIAVIAMSGRFPGAGEDLDKFWHNLREGVESVQFFDRDQLISMGIDEHLLENPKFVAADAVLDDLDLFDAEFFHFSPREAEILDPQHRLFLESSWEAMERAGYTADKYDGRVGVYAGSAMSGYMVRNLKSNPGLIERVGTFKTMLANDKDFLSTRVSYKMGFTGASVNVNTLCSSSAVAIHLACESLLNEQNDLCLAGGVSFQITRNEAFFYQEGSIGSPDGHCRAFDEKASGTVSGSGLGILILKRLTDAIEDRDNVLAVIKGTAINNDGADKASYTAPNPNGQAECIAEAHQMSGVNPEDISYIEAHGTGTLLGDPIEIAGLTKAFRYETDKRQYCAVGSVKTNIGHLVTAGGIASAIKTILALQNKELPPSLNFDRPNPKIDFVNSPFYVNDKLQPWVSDNGPRTAGISSFGIGGTNAHMIVQENIAEIESNELQAPAYPIILSAPKASALPNMIERLLNHLQTSELRLKDVAYTLQQGRKDFAHRQTFVARDIADLQQQLQQALTEQSDKGYHFVQNRARLAMMFSGQGAQFSGMAANLYADYPLFAESVDEQCQLLAAHSDIDVRKLLLEASDHNDELMRQTQAAQLTLFVYQYAKAQLLMSWGLEPKALIGHSIGEYVAACLAEVMTLADGLKLVAARGDLMASMATGAMLSVSASAAQVTPYLSDKIALAAVNAPQLCVLSGSHDAIEALRAELNDADIQSRVLHTSHAFHSHMMADAASQFAQVVAQVTLSAPQITLVSNLTGEVLTDEQAQSAQYWADHLRQGVRFADGLVHLTELDDYCLVEMGPSKVLAVFASACEQVTKGQAICLGAGASARDNGSVALMQGVANIWAYGVAPDWAAMSEELMPCRVALPTYPFERKRYWIEEKHGNGGFAGDVRLRESEEIAPLVAEQLTEQQRDIEHAQVSVDVDWSATTDDNHQQQLERMVKLRQDIAQLCQQAAQDSGLKLNVSGLNLQLSALQSNEQQQPLTRETLTSRYRAPETELQQQIAAHWQNVLGIDRIGLDDNFFELGGHSLLAAALANKLRSEFELQIPLEELLVNPTIAMLAELVELYRWNNNETLDGGAVLEQGELDEGEL